MPHATACLLSVLLIRRGKLEWGALLSPSVPAQVQYSPEVARAMHQAQNVGRLTSLMAALNALGNVPW